MWKIESQFWPIRKQGTMQILKFTKKHQKSGTWNIKKKIRQSWVFLSTSKIRILLCHQSLYQHSVRLCKHGRYHILTAELNFPVKSFDEKCYVFETRHKHLHRNEIPWQAVYNKMALDPIPDELKDLKKSENVLIIIKLKWNFIKGSCICQIRLPSHIPSAYLKSQKVLGRYFHYKGYLKWGYVEVLWY